MRYAFIKAHESQYSVRRMCKVMHVYHSGYYAWKREPQSQRALDDQRLSGLLKQAWLESGSVYVGNGISCPHRDISSSKIPR